MAGGTWDLPNKKRPGTYIKVGSDRAESLPAGVKGVVVLPLFGHPYGPENAWFEITCTGSEYNNQMSKLGFDLTENNEYTRLINAARLGGALKVLCCNLGAGGTKATAELAPAGEEGGAAVTATAMYPGSRGNSLTVAVIANPEGGFAVHVYLDGKRVERYEGLETVEDLIASGSEWVTFAGSGPLTANAGAALTGGTDSEISNDDVAAFLDGAEARKWNVMAFPVDGADADDDVLSLLRMTASKIKYLNDDCGRYVRVVVIRYPADNEHVINACSTPVANGVQLGFDVFACWLAGEYASTEPNVSLTGLEYPGADSIYPLYTNSEIENAIDTGRLILTLNDDNKPAVEIDINSLQDFSKPKDASFGKNRVMRTIDGVCETIKRLFPPNTYDNDDDGWDMIEALGKAKLLELESSRWIKNVDQDEDIKVDRDASVDDQLFIDVYIQPIDSAEKIYIRLHVA